MSFGSSFGDHNEVSERNQISKKNPEELWVNGSVNTTRSAIAASLYRITLSKTAEKVRIV
jgi:hypothetical protein